MMVGLGVWGWSSHCSLCRINHKKYCLLLWSLGGRRALFEVWRRGSPWLIDGVNWVSIWVQSETEPAYAGIWPTSRLYSPLEALSVELTPGRFWPRCPTSLQDASIQGARYATTKYQRASMEGIFNFLPFRIHNILDIRWTSFGTLQLTLGKVVSNNICSLNKNILEQKFRGHSFLCSRLPTFSIKSDVLMYNLFSDFLKVPSLDYFRSTARWYLEGPCCPYETTE